MSSFIKYTLVIITTLFFTNIGFAQSKNIKVANAKVYGNCGMCKKKIEKAGNISGVAKTVWDAESSMASITIDSAKTTVDQILKKIADVGYDNERFRAQDKVYNNLHGCCQYDRPEKVK